MSEKGASVGNRSMGNRYPEGEARLDRERTAEELKRFLELAVREMNLAVEYEISWPDRAQATPDEIELLVAFSGSDQPLLLERNAELLLALEHLAHRWLRLDPRMHDRVRFDCGNYRAGRLEGRGTPSDGRGDAAAGGG